MPNTYFGMPISHHGPGGQKNHTQNTSKQKRRESELFQRTMEPAGMRSSLTVSSTMASIVRSKYLPFGRTVTGAKENYKNDQASKLCILLLPPHKWQCKKRVCLFLGVPADLFYYAPYFSRLKFVCIFRRKALHLLVEV
jgi:hypothetical protein